MVHGGYLDPTFVLLSVVVAILGSWTALDLFRRVRSHIGRTRTIWLGAAGLSMGLSIWSMHFIAMLGFDPGSPVRYDLGLTAVSLGVAVGSTCGAFVAAARDRAGSRRLLIAGFAMGLGICLMHYIGMAALRTAVSLGYDGTLVAMSFAVAVIASTAALIAARRERSLPWRAAAAVILGLAVVGMHYTAMAALRITPAVVVLHTAPSAPPILVGAGVAAGTTLILFLALLASLYDQRLNVLAALEAGGIGYWELSVPDRRLHVSARGKEILGRSPGDPLGQQDLIASLAPEERPRRGELLQRAIMTGEPYDAVYRLEPSVGERWVNVRGRVVGHVRGRPRRMTGVLLDVTDREAASSALSKAESGQRLMIDELNHRVKNTLATVQSIARQTGKRSGSVDDFRRLFEARLIALSQTHNALTRGNWEQASLRELLEQEMAVYSADQVRLEGPDLALAPAAALALGMIFHELATNAAKHGALSTAAGCVTIRWSVAPQSQPELALEWSESRGPNVTEPKRQGFGFQLIKRSLQPLNGSADLEFSASGLICRLQLPLASPH